MINLVAGLWLLAAGAGFAAAAPAAAHPPDTATEAQLLEGAAKEGRLLWYAIPLPINDVIAAEFKKRYPQVQLEVLKAGGTQLIQKFQLEQEQGAASADCVSSGLTEAFPDLRRQGRLSDLSKLPNWKKRPGWTKDPNGSYFYYANFKVGLMYNTNLVPAAQAPSSFAELAEPAWAKKLALFDTTAGFSVPLFRFLVDKPTLGWPWVEKIKANEPLLMVNAAQVDEAVVSGRRAVAIVRDTEALGAQRKGAPVAFKLAKEGHMLHLMPVAVSKRAANPYAARLFVNWLLSDETQKRLAEEKVGVPLHLDEKALKASGGWYLDPERIDPAETKSFLEKLNAALHRP